jgi:hypothetical protein
MVLSWLMIEILLIGLLFGLQLAHGQQSNFLSDFQKTNGSPFFYFYVQISLLFIY